MTRSYRLPDTPETGSNLGGGYGNLNRAVLRSIRTPSVEEREVARQKVRLLAPDLLDVLGLA